MAEVIANLSELQAFTYDHCAKMVTDNIHNKEVMWLAARQNERTYPGGEHIRELLRVASDPNDQTGGPVDRTGAYEIVELPMHDAARYKPRYYVQTIPLWDSDVADNGSSEVQYWDFVSARMSAYLRAMRNRFSRHFYGKSGGGLQINGLGDIFDNSSVFGEIDRSKYDWWRAEIDSSPTARAGTIDQLYDIMAQTSDGNDEPHLILTSDQMWTRYAKILDSKTRYNQNMTLANLGFRHLSFQDIPILKDKNADVDATNRHKTYFLNWDYLSIRPHAMYNFKEHDWMRMPKYLGQYMLIVWFGNLTATSLRRQGMISDLDPELSS